MSAPALGGYDVDPICAGTSYLSWLRMLMFSGKNINSWSEVLPILCGPTWTTALGLASLFAESARIARGSAPAPAARTVESMARSPSPSSRVGGRQLPGARQSASLCCQLPFLGQVVHGAQVLNTTYTLSSYSYQLARLLTADHADAPAVPFFRPPGGWRWQSRSVLQSINEPSGNEEGRVEHRVRVGRFGLG